MTTGRLFVFLLPGREGSPSRRPGRTPETILRWARESKGEAVRETRRRPSASHFLSQPRERGRLNSNLTIQEMNPICFCRITQVMRAFPFTKKGVK